MEVKKGYKQTEVGVIPSDWEVKKLGDCFTFSGGYTASRDQLSNDGYCYLHYGDIHGANKTFIDVKKEYSEIPKLNVPIRKVSPKFLLNEGDVVFVDASEDDEGASKHIVVFNSEGIPFISGLHTIVSKSKNDIIDNGYKRYCFQPYYFKSQFKFYAVGTKVTGISKTNIAKVLIPLPPTKAEQTAIATALSDVDTLIQSLEKFIAKKRNIKQGAMQELLKPKEGWVVKKLGTECELITKGTTPTSVGQEFQSSGVSFIKIESLGEDGHIIMEKIAFIDTATNNLLKRSQLKANDVLISIAGALGRVAIVKREILPANTNQALAIARLKSEATLGLEYLFHFLKSNRIQKNIEAISVQGAQANLSLENINDLPIDTPSTKAEQTRIAAILSDMDAEISALETKLTKYKHIKQGMMQELLTGRIRLV